MNDTIRDWGFRADMERQRAALNEHAERVLADRKRNVEPGLAELRVKAYERWGNRCPCCRHPMRMKKRGKRAVNHRDDPTIGHDAPTSRGGPMNRWLYICHGCNQDQEMRNFRGWAYMLRKAGDRRARFVEEVAAFIEEVAGPWPSNG